MAEQVEQQEQNEQQTMDINIQCKVANIFKWDSSNQKLKWVKGNSNDKKYDDFQNETQKFEVEKYVDLIGRVYGDGIARTVNVQDLGQAYLRQEYAITAGLTKCTCFKNGDYVYEIFP